MREKDRKSKLYRPTRKVPVDFSVTALRAAALAYLARYSASAAKVQRVLERRVLRAAAAGGEAPAEARTNIAQVIKDLCAQKLIQDANFAEAKAARLRRQGASRPQIMARLAADGIERGARLKALTKADEETRTGDACDDEDSELRAARRWVKRRRLGPHRSASKNNEDTRRKDLIALARAGFSRAIALRALTGDEE